MVGARLNHYIKCSCIICLYILIVILNKKNLNSNAAMTAFFRSTSYKDKSFKRVGCRDKISFCIIFNRLLKFRLWRFRNS